MADAKKCDRCGKLFEPYLKLDGYKNPQEFAKLNVMHINMDKQRVNPNENVFVDLCNECHNSFSNWLATPRIRKEECRHFGNIGEQGSECNSCPRFWECEKATKEKATKQENEYKGCNVFGAFDGSVDCLMCPKCDECKEATKTIKEANAGGK